MSPARKRAILIGAALAVIAIVVVAFVLLVNDADPAPATTAESRSAEPVEESPAKVAGRFLQQFQAGDLTGAPVDDPAAASAELSSARGVLQPTAVDAKLGEVPTPSGEATTATFRISWTLAGNSA